MSLPVFNSVDEVCEALRSSIVAAIPDARVEVLPGSPGHFELQVTSKAFEGESMVKQQQRVYAAIKDLMRGDAAPVHAIDQLRTLSG